jgi:hypothetical protein
LDKHGAVLWNQAPMTDKDFEVHLRDATQTATTQAGHFVFAYAGNQASEETRLEASLKRHGFAFQPECHIPPIPGFHVDPRN